MTDAEKIRDSNQLEQYIRELRAIKREVKSRNFKRYKSAGSDQWKGNVKANRFDDQYLTGKLEYDSVLQAIDDAIRTCQSAKTVLDFSISETYVP